jgi:hypothetical protein
MGTITGLKDAERTEMVPLPGLESLPLGRLVISTALLDLSWKLCV